jgi:hypothetical protein
LLRASLQLQRFTAQGCKKTMESLALVCKPAKIVSVEQARSLAVLVIT